VLSGESVSQIYPVKLLDRFFASAMQRKGFLRSVTLGITVVVTVTGTYAGERQTMDQGDSVQLGDAKRRPTTVTDKKTPEQAADIVYTGESTPPPPSPHPNIEVFSLPSALAESVGSYLAEHSLQDLTTEEKVALTLALDKCAKLADLPATLHRMGLVEVSFRPNASLALTCDGYTKESVPEVIGSLLESARGGDIPAMLSLIYLLDPGGPGIRVQVGNQERESGISAHDVYTEAHKLAYRSIPEGNLYYANNVIRHLLIHGTSGFLGSQADGSFSREPHRPSFIKAVAYQEALWTIGADPDRSARGMGLLRRLSAEERGEMQQQADTLVASWLKQPVLFDSDIKAQGYWAPDLY
jgi:hypothetical protein